MQTENTNFIYKNELDKACFQHDMAYGKSKDLAKRTQSDKVLRNKVKLRVMQKFGGYQRGFASMVKSFLIKNLVKVVSLMNQIFNWQMSFINQLLKKLRKEKFIHLSKTIFGVLI